MHVSISSSRRPSIMAKRLNLSQLMVYHLEIKSDVPARTSSIYDIKIIARLWQLAIFGLRVDTMHETFKNEKLG